MGERCEEDRHAQGADGFVFELQHLSRGLGAGPAGEVGAIVRPARTEVDQPAVV
jgi:hypothetical protein